MIAYSILKHVKDADTYSIIQLYFKLVTRSTFMERTLDIHGSIFLWAPFSKEFVPCKCYRKTSAVNWF